MGKYDSTRLAPQCKSSQKLININPNLNC